MGYDCNVYPTYEASPKFQAYCLQGIFPEHLSLQILNKKIKKNKKISKNDFRNSYYSNYKIINKDFFNYYVEVDDYEYINISSFGNNSVKLLFEAELLRINNNYNLSWEKLTSAEAQIIQSGSVEHLCLIHLLKTKLYLDKGEVSNSEYDIFSGLELSNNAKYKILKIDILNEQARFYLSINSQNKFKETIKCILELSTNKSCKYFWGALKAANLMIEAKNIYSKKEKQNLKEALSVFKDVFVTQNHNFIAFVKIKQLMDYK